MNRLIHSWVCLVCLSACSTPADVAAPALTGAPQALVASSDTMAVSGEYAPVALDGVEGMAVENGKLVIKGTAGSATVDAPASADTSRPTRRWALVTEADVDNKRVLVFTHEESLDDFTVELPASVAPIRFGVFERTSGGEVLVLAWGSESRSFWGHVTIAAKPRTER